MLDHANAKNYGYKSCVYQPWDDTSQNFLQNIICVRVSLVSYANAQKNHKKFREYQTYGGIDNTSQDYSLHWHMHGGLCQGILKGILSLYLRPPV